nr:reverse transcriptase domain-containing protein [Tanacetum cinerariifolium]
MSDSEDSTVTYTTVSSPYEGQSGDISPGEDGPSVMPKDPYAYVVAVFQALPSPDYVPGPEEPEQAPPSPVYIPYVPEPEYPEYMPPKDDVFPAEEQSLPTAASPTTDSPGYIPESDPDEDLKDDDDEDPEEDPANYPVDHDDEEEDEEPSGDDADEEDEEQDEEDDDEEEEHPASADSIPPPPALCVTARISFRPQPPTLSFTKEDAERFLAMPISLPSPLTPLSSPLPQIPSPPLPASPPILPIPLPAASPPLQLLSSDHRADRPEVTLPPRKRLSIVHYPEYETGESSAAAARPIEGRRADYGEQRISDMGHLATALGEIRALQAREQARADFWIRFKVCMRTRSSSNLRVEYSPNPTSSNPKLRNRRRSKQPFILEESPIDTMADQRTMAELLRAPTESYAEAIVVPLIFAEQFELKHSLINMMTSDQFFGLEKDNSHDHIRAARRWLEKEPSRSILTWEDLVSKFINEFFPPSRTTNLRNEISNFQQRFDESFHEAWDRYKDLLRAYPHYGFTELHQLDTFYNALNPADQDSLNSAAGGNLDANSSSSSEIAKLTRVVNQQTSACLAADGNTFPKLQDNIQGYISAAAINYNQGNFGYRPSEEMILRDGDERLTLNMRHDTSSYSKQPQKDLINMINIYDDSCEDFLKDLFVTNHLSGSPTFSSHLNLTSSKVKDDIFDLEGDMVLIEKFINFDSTKDLPPPHNINPLSSSTTSSFPNHFLKEFADELALITFPLRNDDLSFDIESDLKEIEYLLNHDPIKEMDSILEDSVDEDNFADLNDNLVDTMPEMFIDEHALDYSSPPLYDEYDDDLFNLEFDTEYVYDDSFDSKGQKLKESKLLIDELDLPRSSDFLHSPEYGSFLFEDFSKVDALPSTNNEEKVFNLGILIHENLFEVITRVAPDKNIKKIAISHASLILEDFNPPLSLYDLPFHKEVTWSETLLSFSSKNEEKVFKPVTLTSKGVHSSFLPKLSHRGHKVFKIIKILESPVDIFPCFYGEDIRILDVPYLHLYPHE